MEGPRVKKKKNMREVIYFVEDSAWLLTGCEGHGCAQILVQCIFVGNNHLLGINVLFARPNNE